jgi:UDP-N-acetylglucosamine:LPS N-acetylglucosamine transferase
MTGGGSGGHITPILAVAHELKTLQPSAQIIYIGQTGDALSDVPAAHPAVDKVYAVSAGKFRRYANEGWRQYLNLREQFLNVRDLFRMLHGIWQSYWLLRRLKPDVVFTRGGFVSVPVALGACLNRVPYITHDSDSLPALLHVGLTRMLWRCRPSYTHTQPPKQCWWACQLAATTSRWTLRCGPSTANSWGWSTNRLYS